MKKNVGTIDALMRITIGLTGVAWGTSRMIRKPNSNTPLFITLASAMKVAEGVTRFCPTLSLFDTNSEHMMEKDQEQQNTKRISRPRNHINQGKNREPMASKEQFDDFFEPQH